MAADGAARCPLACNAVEVSGEGDMPSNQQQGIAGLAALSALADKSHGGGVFADTHIAVATQLTLPDPVAMENAHDQARRVPAHAPRNEMFWHLQSRWRFYPFASTRVSGKPTHAKRQRLGASSPLCSMDGTSTVPLLALRRLRLAAMIVLVDRERCRALRVMLDPYIAKAAKRLVLLAKLSRLPADIRRSTRRAGRDWVEDCNLPRSSDYAGPVRSLPRTAIERAAP